MDSQQDVFVCLVCCSIYGAVPDMKTLHTFQILIENNEIVTVTLQMDTVQYRENQTK